MQHVNKNSHPSRSAARPSGCEMREPYAVKVARTVPGRGEGGNTFSLFDCQDEDFYSKCKNRSQCERKHKHIKDTVKFDIRGLLHTSKEMYTYASFVSYQILILAHAQLKIENVNVFCDYI